MYELAGRQADLPLREVIVHFRDLVSVDIDWADSRKTRFRLAAFRLRIASVTLGALSTVILGTDAIRIRSQIALPMVAAITVLGALDNFFNWRARWATMEETRYHLNRLRDEMDYYLTVTPSTEVAREALDRFFEDQQRIWRDVSRRWVELQSAETAERGNRTMFPGPDSG